MRSSLIWQVLQCLVGTAAVMALAWLVLLSLPVRVHAGLSELCRPVQAVRAVLEVLDFEPMWVAYDGGKSQTGVIFMHRKDLRRIRVSCLDGRAELFRKAQ